ncbi:MAG: hypothetical protein HYX27_17120 [Acidobacteria bacterium]|nr:hypothetical protein [Acidobacteriota bacterium]
MPAITTAQINALNTTTLSAADDIGKWTGARLKAPFLTWFNRNIAGKGPWSGVSLVDTPANHAAFRDFWDNIATLTGGGAATPFQFLALMGIFANECRANFKPASEKMGRAGYPGLSYLYDAIPGCKRSYNTLDGNKTALECFNSAAFHNAHAAKTPAARLRNTTDARWAGAVYPRADFSTAPNAATAYIMETDFMKFRGRGFIQTTGRANYASLIRFILDYNGADTVLNDYRDQWTGRAIDDIADASSNDDWDRLFQETGLAIAAAAIRLHNMASGNYLALDGDPDKAVVNMGKRISGGAEYAAKYRDRMEVLIVRVLS